MKKSLSSVPNGLIYILIIVLRVNIVAAMAWLYRPKVKDVSIGMNVLICHV